jgi:DNA-binding response OmpR family regulator
MTTGGKLILGFVVNMMFTTRIESVAEAAGYEVRWVESIEDWENPTIDKLLRINPDLILIDLSISDIQWKDWISQVKSFQTKNELPIVCFGSHMDIDGFKSAKLAGADRVISRSMFFSSIAKTLEKYAN